MGTAIAEAEEVYYMANGAYTTDFSALDLDFGAATLGENDLGTYSQISGKWGRCVLRDYGMGTVQCSSWYTEVPEFEKNFSSAVRYCHAFFSKGDVAQRVCKLETHTETPYSTFQRYATYRFK